MEISITMDFTSSGPPNASCTSYAGKTKEKNDKSAASNFSVPEQQDYIALKVSIGKCFQSGFGSSLQVANFIRYTSLCANDGNDGLNNFDLLVEVFDNMRDSRKFSHLLNKILPAMQDLVKHSGTVLDKFCLSSERSVATLSRQEILSLLSCSFFCCFPKSGYDKGHLLNFSQLYQKEYGSYQNNKVKMEKIKCLLHYFEFAASHFNDTSIIMLEEVTFKRIVVRKPLDCANSSKKICNLIVIDEKKAPDDTRTRVDFAHSNIGGGVLSNGSLQEEILFITCPELIASRFFSSKMKNNEAIIIDGVYQYSQYYGYADNFTCAGASHAGMMRNSLEVAAMDAINFSDNELMQYSRAAVDRELTKAYAAFSAVSGKKIASGNWGGGCFKGNPVLKAKIQKIAASEAGKEVQYVTFQTPGLAQKIKHQVNHENCSYTVSKEYEELLKWCDVKCSRNASKMSSHTATTTTYFKVSPRF